MSTTAGLFYLFSAVLLFAAFRVITSRNPVHAALYLVLTFFQASMVWMLLGAEFLSITLVLVYVGAVMVLFLFVVMMMDINVESLREGFWVHFPLIALLGVVMALEMSAVLMGGFRVAAPPPQAASDVPNTQQLGQLLYSEYLYPVEIAATILLVAMIAAIALTLRQRKDSKAISASEQVHVRAKDRLVVVKMDAVKVGDAPKAPEAPAEAEASKETK